MDGRVSSGHFRETGVPRAVEQASRLFKSLGRDSRQGRHLIELNDAGHPAVAGVELHLVLFEEPHRLAILGLKPSSAVGPTADKQGLARVLGVGHP
jgi:hypothetical protein